MDQLAEGRNNFRNLKEVGLYRPNKAVRGNSTTARQLFGSKSSLTHVLSFRFLTIQGQEGQGASVTEGVEI